MVVTGHLGDGAEATMATLTLRYLAGENAEPRLRQAEPLLRLDHAFKESISASLAWAEGQSRFPQNGAVVWQISFSGKAIPDLEGGSAGAAFAIGLAFMFRLTRAAKRRLDNRAVTSAQVEASGLLGPVHGLERKVPVVDGHGYRLIVASQDQARAKLAGTGRKTRVKAASSVPEAIAFSRLPRSRTFAVAVAVAVTFTFLGNWVLELGRRSAAAGRAQRAAALEQQSRDSIGSKPDQAIELVGEVPGGDALRA